MAQRFREVFRVKRVHNHFPEVAQIVRSTEGHHCIERILQLVNRPDVVSDVVNCKAVV
jgi:formylmethanofuran dehydrogenase subunit E